MNPPGRPLPRPERRTTTPSPLESRRSTPGFASVAAAAHDHTGHPVAGLALTFAVGDVEDADLPQLARAVTLAAAELTRRLGGGRTRTTP